MKLKITTAVQFRGHYRRPIEGDGGAACAVWAANGERREKVPSLYRDHTAADGRLMDKPGSSLIDIQNAG